MERFAPGCPSAQQKSTLAPPSPNLIGIFGALDLDWVVPPSRDFHPFLWDALSRHAVTSSGHILAYHEGLPALEASMQAGAAFNANPMSELSPASQHRNGNGDRSAFTWPDGGSQWDAVEPTQLDTRAAVPSTSWHAGESAKISADFVQAEQWADGWPQQATPPQFDGWPQQATPSQFDGWPQQAMPSQFDAFASNQWGYPKPDPVTLGRPTNTTSDKVRKKKKFKMETVPEEDSPISPLSDPARVPPEGVMDSEPLQEPATSNFFEMRRSGEAARAASSATFADMKERASVASGSLGQSFKEKRDSALVKSRNYSEILSQKAGGAKQKLSQGFQDAHRKFQTSYSGSNTHGALVDDGNFDSHEGTYKSSAPIESHDAGTGIGTNSGTQSHRTTTGTSFVTRAKERIESRSAGTVANSTDIGTNSGAQSSQTTTGTSFVTRAKERIESRGAGPGIGTNNGTQSSQTTNGASLMTKATGSTEQFQKKANDRAEQAQQKVAQNVANNMASAYTGGAVKNVPPGATNAALGYAKNNPKQAMKFAKFAAKGL